jgi:hypothetical protein
MYGYAVRRENGFFLSFVHFLICEGLFRQTDRRQAWSLIALLNQVTTFESKIREELTCMEKRQASSSPVRLEIGSGTKQLNMSLNSQRHLSQVRLTSARWVRHVVKLEGVGLNCLVVFTRSDIFHECRRACKQLHFKLLLDPSIRNENRICSKLCPIYECFQKDV